MARQTDLDGAYMHAAMAHARLSKAARSRVGATLVTKHGVMIPGYNGTPAGTSNVCEDWVPNTTTRDMVSVTKPEVLHAELNCILKAAKEGIAVAGSTVYVTLSPCIQCAAMMVQLGISRVVYDEPYRKTDGIDYLKANGIKVEKY